MHLPSHCISLDFSDHNGFEKCLFNLCFVTWAVFKIFDYGRGICEGELANCIFPSAGIGLELWNPQPLVELSSMRFPKLPHARKVNFLFFKGTANLPQRYLSRKWLLGIGIQLPSTTACTGIELCSILPSEDTVTSLINIALHEAQYIWGLISRASTPSPLPQSQADRLKSSGIVLWQKLPCFFKSFFHAL